MSLRLLRYDTERTIVDIKCVSSENDFYVRQVQALKVFIFIFLNPLVIIQNLCCAVGFTRIV